MKRLKHGKTRKIEEMYRTVKGTMNERNKENKQTTFVKI